MDSLQDRYAPNNECFGCGPANAQGLRIKSFVSGDEVVADWRPQPHHQAFPGVLNGGIATAQASIEANGRVTATTCRGTFVAVREGHPAFHRW